ncbi:hypothetical protein TARUN_2959 [Trichoderma arundinaceum]|uniref:DUF7587 domain-containing protein n=1 Tax=Trichoderma arundinaceum TaxID=490622 RepID=A0A395NTT9_TRIAR|nr:hypothetical protein TARUN_2959 [Trichoderma arundinaceum]
MSYNETNRSSVDSLLAESANLLSISDKAPELFKDYERHPVNSFQRPIWYRVVHSDSPPESEEGSLQSRLYPPPELEDLHPKEMRLHLENHAEITGKTPTPFISVTFDLIRAFHMAYAMYGVMEDVTILLIDPWLLPEGNYHNARTIRSKSGLKDEPKYNTEILVWGEIPKESILYRWSQSDIFYSGLFNVFPSLGTQMWKWASIDDRRADLRSDYSRFDAAKTATFAADIAKALVSLGMDPSRLQMKQIFVFLLGEAAGFDAEKEMGGVEAKLEAQAVKEFDDAAYKLCISASCSHAARLQHVIATNPYLRNSQEGRRFAKIWADLIQGRLYPTIESWRLRREERDFIEWGTRKEMTGGGKFTLIQWLSQFKPYTRPTVTSVGFVEDDA